MSEVLVGSAYALFDLRYQGFTQGVSAVMAQLQQLRQAAAQPIVATVTAGASGSAAGGGGPSTAQAVRGVADDTKAAEQATLRYASSLAQAQKAQGDLTGAAQTYRTALASLTPTTIDYNAALARLATTENAAAKEASGAAQQFGTSFGGSLTSMLGPAALAGAAIGGVTTAVNSFTEAFKFKSELDQTNASIRVQLQSFRDVNQVIAQATAFGQRYKLTQQETNEAIQASIPILRQSKASADEVLSTLLRLSVLKPEQGIQGAAFALAELQGGQARSLETRFNIPIAQANELKKAIEDGSDAVQVLSDYLGKAGVGMDALAVRTQGAAGALHDYQKSLENLKIAQGDFATGPGAAFLAWWTRVTEGGARLFGGGGGIQAGLRNFQAEVQAGTAQQDAYIAALDAGKSKTEATAAGQAAYNDVIRIFIGTTQEATDASDRHTEAELRGVDAADRHANASAQLSTYLTKEAKDKLDSQIKGAELAAQQQELAHESLLAAQGMLVSGDQALALVNKYGIAASAAQFLINQQQALFNGQALADQRAGERSGGAVRTQAEQTALATTQRTAAQTAVADQAKLLDSQIALAAAHKNTGQQIDLLRKKQADYTSQSATDVAARNQIEAQIVGIQDAAEKAAERAGRARSTAANKGLSALDKSTIDLAGQGLKDYQAQLDLVNQKLAAGNLTALQRNELIKDQLTLQQKITDEQTKQQDAALSAAASAIENRKAQRQETRQLTLLDRMAGAGGERGAEASDEAALIRIRAEQRTRSLNREITAAGGVTPTLGTQAGTAAMPIGAAGANGVTPLLQPGGAAGGAANGVNLNITLEVGSDVFASATLRNVQSGARVALRSNQAAGA